ncbi:MAG TPA: hypothetical protein VHB27_15725 [Rhodopila sp.]|uniref:hypothetical protein n=1 Tax=Rhodopila sp. TaxID=2480087 RepID=UPI002C4BAD44|nr:hypothetical protein [Rhodopila sp.]HVY16674.1 hypothetical protein [Rhodopila sp.]
MAKATPHADYHTSVFVNCPFDLEYQPILHAIVFAIMHCGYTVRCALEAEDTGTPRIDRIYSIIEACRFGVHDISRVEHDLINALPRFNMPFELGLFLGARRFGPPSQRSKQCLVLEAERFRYQKFLSDIAGQDIRQHGGDPTKAVGAIRDWLVSMRPKSAKLLPGAKAIMHHYQDFVRNLPAALKALDIEPNELGFVDRAHMMALFLETRGL